jgi:hypothetical protein
MDRISTMRELLRSLRTARKKMVRAHAVDPHQYCELLFLMPHAVLTPRVAVNSLADDAILYLRGPFSPDEERSRDVPHGGVQPGDEGQAAHELQSLDVERSRDVLQTEVQSVDGLHAAYGRRCSHVSELWPLYSRLPCSHAREL